MKYSFFITGKIAATKKRSLSLFICLFLSATISLAQDIHFSQFFNSPILLNPAASGASDPDYRLAVNYKNQWKSVINPFKTAAIAFDTKLFRKEGAKNYAGLGISYFNDQVGMSKLTTNQGNIDLAYHLGIKAKSRLSFGVKAGFFQKYINPAGLKWDNQYNGKDFDAGRPTGELLNNTSFNNIDLGGGLVYTYSRDNSLQYQGGFSAMHLTRPANSFYSADESMHLKYTGFVNMQYQPKEKSYMVLPSVLFAMQGGHMEIVGGSNVAFSLIKGGDSSGKQVRFNAIHFGAFYRYGDAAIFVASLEYKKCMKFGISYDVNLSRFTGATKFRGGPEFSFVYTGLRKVKKKPEVVAKDSVPVLAPQPEKPAMADYSGTVYDAQDKPVRAEVSILPLNTDTISANRTGLNKEQVQNSDSASGKYQISLKAGQKYRITVSAKGFEPYEEEVDLTALNKYTESQKDFHLKPEKQQLAVETKTEVPLPEKHEEPVKQSQRVAPCNGKPFPDFASLKQKSLDNEENYQRMLRVFDDYCEEGLVFKVQIAAYPIKLKDRYDYRHLKQYGKPEIVDYPDGLTRFTSGSFGNIKETEQLRLKIIKSGQTDAWIVGFINGQRFTLEQLIQRLSEK